MPILTALAISIGVLGGLATWLFIGPMAGLGLQIWAAFIAWAAFYHSGGKEAALKTNIRAHVFGALVGLVALIGTTSLAGALGVPVAAAICVGIGAAVIVLAANGKNRRHAGCQIVRILIRHCRGDGCGRTILVMLPL